LQRLALLLVGPSAPDIGSNPNLIRKRRSVGDVVIAGARSSKIAWTK
jgi:hypothetical protein